MILDDIQLYYDARAEVLVTLRLGTGLSIDEYSESIDISYGTYRNYEKGVTIAESFIFKIIAYNNISMVNFETMIEKVMDRKKAKR
jgi:Helix-turn-helix